jgi:hypothetical protein
MEPRTMIPRPPPLLTVEALAVRWTCAPKTAWEIVRRIQVPLLQIGRYTKRPREGPKYARFRLADIERWEESIVTTLPPRKA